MYDIRYLIGKDVEVLSNGVRYSGVLVEVSDDEVHLKTSTQWLSLPTAMVSEVKPNDQKLRGLEQSIDWGSLE